MVLWGPLFVFSLCGVGVAQNGLCCLLKPESKEISDTTGGDCANRTPECRKSGEVTAMD